MASDLHRKVSETFFGRYGASCGADLPSNGDPSGGLDYTIRFYSYDGFKQFLEEISQIQQLIDERYARELNPTLQRAYDEYKLLLKLSK